MAVSSAGKTLAVAGPSNISLWSTSDRRRVGRPLRVKASALAFDPRGRFLTVGGASGKLSVWDVRTGQRVVKGVSAGPYGVNSIAYRRDGRVIASAGSGGSIRLWNDRLHPWSRPIAAAPHSEGFTSIVFTPDGRIAACEDLGVVRIWIPETGKSIGKPMKTGCDSSAKLAVSPDGRTLAAGGTVVLTLWDLRTHEQLGQRLFVNADAVAFSPDGATLATAGASATRSGSPRPGVVQLWDVATRRKIGRAVPGYSDVAFSRHGNVLVSAGSDKIAFWNPLLWSQDEGEFRRRICRVVGRNLTRPERDAFVAKGPYRPAC